MLIKTSLKLIVGLGNPGREYQETRHTAGFWLLDRMAHQREVRWSHERAYQAMVAKVAYQKQVLWLMKPQTFMNRSGFSVAGFAHFYKIAPQEILIVHDELDLPPGVVKLKHGGSHAGHNGLKDIAARLGSLDFWRLRVGIGHPRTLGLTQEVVDFVLHRAGHDHQAEIDAAIDKALTQMNLIISGRFDQAMKQLHAG